jgi:hypothetical protein
MGAFNTKISITIIAVVVAAIAVSAVVFLTEQRTPVAHIDGEETKSIVPLNQIVSGGPPRDGIPSIDNPKFLSAQEANLQNGDLVLGLEINDDRRAYPLDILVWHEIVNDVVGSEPVAVTYCPLCFTNQVFKRTVEGEVVEFGTSGKLYNSNLVMYDRSTESYWSQALGQAIVGERTGYLLERVPFDVAYWEDWKAINPDTKVLSRDTGFGRPYGADPYGGYYTSPSIYFPISNHDNRLGVKEIIVGLEHDDVYRAYPLSTIEEQHAINDDLAGRSILLVSHYPFMARAFDRTVDGQVLEFEYKDNVMTDMQTGSVWNFDGIAFEGELAGKQLERLPFDQGFWFEWVAFHPETEVY